MSLTITLYKNCKLTKKYHEVYTNRTSLASYLSGLSKLQVYSGDDIYYTNSGTISIDNSGLTVFTADTYNYMVIRSGLTEDESRYCFIDSITLVNEVAVISYTEDIWHNYAIKISGANFNLNKSVLEQTKHLYSFAGCPYTATELGYLPKKLPLDYEGQNYPEFHIFPNENLSEAKCYILAVVSLYQLSAEGEINKREINNYLLAYKRNTASDSTTPLNPYYTYEWDLDNQTLEVLAQLQAMSSDTLVQLRNELTPNWYYELVDIKLIPKEMGDIWFKPVLDGDTEHLFGIREDTKVSGINTYDWDSGNTYMRTFPTDIGFNNLQLSYYLTVKSPLGDPDGTPYYQYNGYLPSARLTYTYPILYTDKVIAIGNLSRIIPKNFNGTSSCKCKVELSLNQYGNKISLYFDNTITDISKDLTLDIPIKAQSSDTTQQQKIARETANIVGVLGLVGSAVNTGTRFSSTYSNVQSGDAKAGDLLGAGAGLVSGVMNNISQGLTLNAKNSSAYLTNKIVSLQDIAVMNCILGGIREIEIVPENEKVVDQLKTNYGYLYQFIIDDVRYFYASGNYIKLRQANVYGNFSQDIARTLESILENGTILL